MGKMLARKFAKMRARISNGDSSTVPCGRARAFAFEILPKARLVRFAECSGDVEKEKDDFVTINE